MPALYPGGDLTYLQLYGQLHALGFVHGRDFRRRNGGGMGWFFEVSDEAFQAWVASKADSGSEEEPPAPKPEPEAKPEAESGDAEPVTEPVTEPGPENRKTTTKASSTRRTPRKGRTE